MYLRNFILRRKIKLVQLADIIINDMNITRNDIVMIHTSLRNINLIDSHPEDLIHLLKMIVGTQGTLLMPTFSESHYKNLNSELLYKIRSASIRFDLINESFRQMPDTIQSCLPTESFAAWGKMTKSLSEENSKSENGFDAKNLFGKLCLLSAKIIGIGVSLTDFSFLHTIGDILYKDYPERYSKPIKKINVDSTGEKFTGHYLHDLSDIIKSKSSDEISKFFEEVELRTFKKRGIPFFWLSAEKVYNKILVLSKSGISG
jgi:aminoglycoside N3'-acetyltransferase